MNIIIVGCGKVGLTLAEQLCQEDHAITLIDTDQERLDDAVNAMDVQAVLGNGTSYQTQIEAGIKETDLLIAVTDQDELNMLSCLIARRRATARPLPGCGIRAIIRISALSRMIWDWPWSSTRNGRRRRIFSACCRSPQRWMWTPLIRVRST